MIVFVSEGCPDCKKLVDHVIDHRLQVELVDGDKLLKSHIDGKGDRFTKLEIVDMLAALAMQDDAFPLVKIGEDFLGKKEITERLGVTFNA